jgi:hypothetical protein
MSIARHRPTAGLALAVAFALGLSACTTSTTEKATSAGSATASLPGNSAEALFQQLRKSSAAAKSVRIKGAISNGATASSKAVKVKIDIAGDRAGKNLRAIVNDGTGNLEILTAGGATYFKADSAYWTKNGNPSIAKLAAGKYVRVPAGSSAGANIPTVGSLLDQIFAKDISAASKLNTTVKKTEVAGVPAYLMTTKTDKTKVFVSADGQARLIRVEGPTAQLGALDFTEWNAVAPFSPPPASQVVAIPTR